MELQNLEIENTSLQQKLTSVTMENSSLLQEMDETRLLNSQRNWENKYLKICLAAMVIGTIIFWISKFLENPSIFNDNISRLYHHP